MSIYVMPNGRKYRFSDDEVPAGAVKVEKKAKKQPEPEKKPAKKAAAKPKNKAKTASNKTKKVADK